jgi:medium-chain acyl-[acyl-carrier-protein] hydrolase
MKNPWIVTHSSSRRTTQRLFCFPYAGGNAQVFRAWAEHLPPSIELIGIQAPGKGSRVMETPYSTLQELSTALLADIEPMLFDRPFSFFGHSNGALVAFELSCVLQERGLPLPRHLFLSASPAPWTRVFDRPYSAMSDDEFIGKLESLSGTPPEVLRNRELLDVFLPGLRADFSLAEGYAFARARKLAVPTSIFYGAEDEIEEVQIRSWQQQLESEAHFEQIPGGHFFIHSHVDLLTGLVARQLAAA